MPATTGRWQFVVNSYLINSDEQNRPHPGKVRRTATLSHVRDQDRPRFIGAMNSVTGVRGAIAPFPGSCLAMSGFGLTNTLLLSSGIALGGH
jgi:hypothetical protein